MPKNMRDRMPEKMLKNIPDRKPEPEELFENMLGKMSEKISEDMPGTADRMQKTIVGKYGQQNARGNVRRCAR